MDTLLGGSTGCGDSRSKVEASFDAMFRGFSFQSLLLDESPLPDFPPCDLSGTPLFSGSTSFCKDPSPLSLVAPKTEPIDIYELAYEPLQFQTPLPSLNYSIQTHEVDVSSETPLQLPQFTKPRCSSRRSYTLADSASKRRHRSNITERMQRLEKLMPWKSKKDRVTMLEEAYKYIKFLEAQVTALQSMPSSNHSLSSSGYGPLGRLSRQKLLQVVVNSPASQTALYSHGCCLASAEQLDLLKENAERMRLTQQLQIDYSSSSSNFYQG